jgi:hypothetical protein
LFPRPDLRITPREHARVQPEGANHFQCFVAARSI